MALAIALPSLGLLFREGLLALDVTGSAHALEDAVSRARSHLAMLEGPALRPGEREGDDGGGYRWHVRVSPLANVGPTPNARPGAAYANGTALYAAEVEISWQGARGPERLALQTRRLGPAGL